MSECFRTDSSSRLLLESIIPDRRCCSEPRLDITGIGNPPLLRRISPDPCETVRLQFQPNRERIRRLRALLLQGMNLRLNAQNLLHVMSNLVCDHIRLREFSGRSEAGSSLVEETEIKINFFVFRTVKRPDCLPRQTTSGWICVAEQHQLGVAVRPVLGLGENGFPILLYVIQHERNKLNFCSLCRVSLAVGRPLRHLSRATVST